MPCPLTSSTFYVFCKLDVLWQGCLSILYTVNMCNCHKTNLLAYLGDRSQKWYMKVWRSHCAKNTCRHFCKPLLTITMIALVKKFTCAPSYLLVILVICQGMHLQTPSLYECFLMLSNQVGFNTPKEAVTTCTNSCIWAVTLALLYVVTIPGNCGVYALTDLCFISSSAHRFHILRWKQDCAFSCCFAIGWWSCCSQTEMQVGLCIVFPIAFWHLTETQLKNSVQFFAWNIV